MTNHPLVPTPLDPESTLAAAGQVANQYAAQDAFADYLTPYSHKSTQPTIGGKSARPGCFDG
jgi:hypothetical protein